MKWQDIKFNVITDGVMSLNGYYSYHIVARIKTIAYDSDGVYAFMEFRGGCGCCIQIRNATRPIPIIYSSVIAHCDRCKEPLFRVSFETNGHTKVKWNLQIPKR